jgi:hypothetical protein
MRNCKNTSRKISPQHTVKSEYGRENEQNGPAASGDNTYQQFRNTV